MRNHLDAGGQVVGQFVIRVRSLFGYEVTRLKTKMLVSLWSKRDHRLVSKSEGLKSQDHDHCMLDMFLR